MFHTSLKATKAYINISNLKKNYLNLRKKSGNRKVMAVVKANAYGHDVKIVTDALNTLGSKKPEYYAVAFIEEGVELRKLSIKQPVLVFDTVSKENANLYFQHNLIPNIFSLSQLTLLKELKKSLGYKKRLPKFPVQVEVDTGMNRTGIDFNAAFDFIRILSRDEDFLIDGIYTHFATADEKNNSLAKIQLKRFYKLLAELKKKDIDYGIVHAANSGAVLNYPDSYFDMIRPGISLYGYYPSLNTTKSVKLYPVLSLESAVGTVKSISAGDRVSYGTKYKAKKKTTIISLPVGYADGFNRNLTNKSTVIIKAKKYKQVGTVTMDRIMVDVGKDKIEAGDKALLIGRMKNVEITAWDWSNILKTIPYEITCSISKRVPRIKKN